MIPKPPHPVPTETVGEDGVITLQPSDIFWDGENLLDFEDDECQ